MAGIYGIDPILNFTYEDELLHLNRSKMKTTFEPDTLMHYIEENNPTFAYMVKKARLSQIFGDLQFRGTIFLPEESCLDKNIIMNMDINTLRSIVKYHMMNSFVPNTLLFSSPYQQLQSGIPGQYIKSRIIDNEIVLNNNVDIIEYEIRMKNGFIHKINKLMTYPFENILLI